MTKFIHTLGKITCLWGFRSLHSTVLAFSKHGLGQAESVIFLDIKEAFNTLNHEVLPKRLSRHGFCKIEFLIPYLHDPMQCFSSKRKCVIIS